MEACMIPMTLLMASVLGAGADLEGVVLDFTAPWCGPCQQLSPMVSRLERQGFPIRKIDCDSNRELVNRFHVKQIPAFVLVINGEEQGRLGGGGVSEDDLKRLCVCVPRKHAATPATERASETNPDARFDEKRGEPAAVAAPKSSPDKSGAKFPFLSAKKDNTPVRDQREGSILRGKAEERTNRRDAVLGNPLAASVRIRVKD